MDLFQMLKSDILWIQVQSSFLGILDHTTYNAVQKAWILATFKLEPMVYGLYCTENYFLSTKNYGTNCFMNKTYQLN